jgi:hypothetical protein
MAVSLSTLRSKHPEWNLVDFTYAPNGGIWAVGADGGVFTLNAEGDQGGTEAPFLGSYWSDWLAPHRDDPSRTFEGIQSTDTGYKIITAGGGGTGYDFYGLPTQTVPPPADLGPQAPPAPETTNPADTSGRDLFTASLVEQGFTQAAATSIANQVWDSSKTKSEEELTLDVRNTAEYKARFGGLVALRDRAGKGEYIPYIPSEAEYVQSERGYMKAARDAGLPASFFDSPDDFAKLIGNGVSVSEYATRIGMAQQAALGTDPTLRQELARVWGASIGDLTAFFLDPDKGSEVIQTKFTQAQIGAASRRSGFGMLTQAEIETLQGRGLTGPGATSALADVAGVSPLEAELATEGTDLTRAQQLGLATGEAADVAAFERRRRSRQAAFEGGGGAAGGGAGTTGLGSAR